MPKKKIIYTHEHPYHVMARSNNKEWFYLPIEICWPIFIAALKATKQKYGLGIYEFVLMDNHYHMICQCSEKHKLGEAMNFLQKTTSNAINKKANRINHVYGGPYKATLIREPSHFAEIFKYVARNPVKAGITPIVEKYKYSTINSADITVLTDDEWFADIPVNRTEWLNIPFEEEKYISIQRALKRTEFKLAKRTRFD
ncbi:transposase [Bdellovibrio sp. HCB185ZH]|uniref:transposase n=1 Tax=Bdellovibrio sp. HCB185ZH TaxID=3394235 RepID=UPI0039A765E3